MDEQQPDSREDQPTEPQTGVLDAIRHPKKRDMLLAFMRTCRVRPACRLAKVNHQTHYNWLMADPAYRDAFEQVRWLASDMLEDECVRRGHRGVLEPVYQGGKLVGEIRRYSDLCLLAALRANRPERWCNQARSVIGSVNVHADNRTLNIGCSSMTPDPARAEEMMRQREELRRLLIEDINGKPTPESGGNGHGTAGGNGDGGNGRASHP